jgi:hypothetical protein
MLFLHRGSRFRAESQHITVRSLAVTFKDVRKLLGQRVRMLFDDGREIAALLLCATKDVGGSKHLIYDDLLSALCIMLARSSRSARVDHHKQGDLPPQSRPRRPAFRTLLA